MTKLETTINRILAQKAGTAGQEMVQREIKADAEQRTKQYLQEFDSIYRMIGSIGQIEREFIEWADQCKIDDADKQIVNGTGFYRHLIKKARSAYQSFRDEGYEPRTAFDKGTQGLVSWIQKPYQEKGEGTIYVNHSRQFMGRLRKTDW